LLPLAEMAQDTGVAAVMVKHLNKSGEMKALYRGRLHHVYRRGPIRINLRAAPG
jgi:hypothetical protein